MGFREDVNKIVIFQVCMAPKGKNDWLQQWMDLAKRFAFQHNPALQPRAIVVFGCISKAISEAEIKQLLRILKKALESEGVLIEGVVMCLTRLQPLLKQVGYALWSSPILLYLVLSSLCFSKAETGKNTCDSADLVFVPEPFRNKFIIGTIILLVLIYYYVNCVFISLILLYHYVISIKILYH